MATIELDIIKQRSDKLMPDEKLELINYLTASLAVEELGQLGCGKKDDDNLDKRAEELP